MAANLAVIGSAVKGLDILHSVPSVCSPSRSALVIRHVEGRHAARCGAAWNL